VSNPSHITTPVHATAPPRSPFSFVVLLVTPSSVWLDVDGRMIAVRTGETAFGRAYDELRTMATGRYRL
jgi:hypothetical protein